MSTVLIVDDSVSYRREARALLEAEGYVVVGEAGDGRSGIELALALSPEVVLLDIGLPDIDGFEVARRLARTSVRPVVVLTSSRDAAEYGSRLAASATAGFIAKEELSGRAVSALLVRARPASGAAQ